MLLLGPFALYRDGVPIDTSAWHRSAVVLLMLLATSPRWQRSREDLIAILWPDATPEAGASNLRSTLHRLRRALGGGDLSPVLFERGIVSLNRGYRWEIDLDRFEELMRNAGDEPEQLEKAVALYRGEPLPEHHYDDWALSVRERALRLWRDGCVRLARQLRERGECDAAIQRLEWVLDHDPLDEEAVRALLCVLGSAGRRTEALRRFQHFERRLKEEMDIPPEPATISVVQQLQTVRQDAPAVVETARHSAATVPARRRVEPAQDDREAAAPELMETTSGASPGRSRTTSIRSFWARRWPVPNTWRAIVGGMVILAVLAAVTSIPLLARFSAQSRAITVYRVSATWSDLDRAPGTFSQPRVIAADRQGNLYVGDTGNRRIQKLSLSGRVLEEWSVEGGNAVIEGVAVDREGNLYVCDAFNDRILKYSPAGRLLTQWGKEGLRPGEFNGPSALALDENDNLYVADTENGRVQKLSPEGKALEELSFPFAGNPPLPSGVAVDQQGNVYAAEMFTRSVYRFSPGGKLLARRPLPGPAVGDGTRPIGLAVDLRGNVYVADSQSNRILKLPANAAAQGAWGSVAGRFRSPQGVAVDAHGNTYVADTGNNRIEKLSPAGRPLAQWGGSDFHPGRLRAPSGVAIDSRGDLYVADTGNGRIVKLSSQGQLLEHWGAGIPGLNQPFVPNGMAVGIRGDVYVAELGGWIERLSANGKPLGRWGQPGSPFSGLVCPCQVAADPGGYVYVVDRYDWGIARQFTAGGKLHRTVTNTDPNVVRIHHSGIALDREGDIYLSDGDAASVTELSPAGKLLARWGKRGSRPGELSSPQGIAVDATGDVYVADAGNSRIEKFSADGAFLTSMGKEGSGAGQLLFPRGVAVDSDGNVYIADTGNDRVVKFAREG